MSEGIGQEVIIQEKPTHYGVIYIYPEFLVDLMRPSVKGRAFRCIKGLPDNARIVRAGYDDPSGRFAIVVEHPNFAEVLAGERIPEVYPSIFESLYIDNLCSSESDEVEAAGEKS